MQVQTYRSPSLIPAGAIADMTAAVHIDGNSPEPGGSGGSTDIMSFRSPEPMGTKPSIVNLQGLKPAAVHIDGNSPEPVERFRFAFRSPEPGGSGGPTQTMSFRSPEPIGTSDP